MTNRATPILKDYLKAGRYVRSVDPDTVTRLKADGEPTDLESLGRRLYESDPETFDRIADEATS